MAMLILISLAVRSPGLLAQIPDITVRFANPQFSCGTGEYCLDVEFQSNMPEQILFGMNVRFFYSDNVLELIDFRDFQGGYGPVDPNPPIISTNESAGPALFNFSGAAEFINGAVQLVNANAPPIVIDTGSWTKLYKICFLVDDPNANLDTFCPSIVWDLEQDPANGGFLSGDDGVVFTVVDPDPNNESAPANANVVQYNWQYIGNGAPPFGVPIETTCSSINCALPLTLLSFKGTPLEEHILLEWKTLNEVNVQGFQLQRTTDRIYWSDLDFVPATNSHELNVYSALDTKPQPGINFYRLKQIDLDGRIYFSPIIHVPFSFGYDKTKMSIYPNPVKDSFLNILITDDILLTGELQLFDVSGQLVWTGSLSKRKTQLEVSLFPPGLYYLCAFTGNEHIYQKVVIQ